MRSIGSSRLILGVLDVLGVVAVLALPSGVSAKPAAVLGRIDFPVTLPRGFDEARRHFLRGMLAMHSFWYDEAKDEFHAATTIAPSFVMGYWGEALTYYHPVWAQEDIAASRAVLAKVPADAKVTGREQGLLDAARLLTGEGDRQMRWTRYADALAVLHERWPSDDELATLYALSLLGNANATRYVDRKDPGFGLFARAAAISLDVLARNPDHPGAAHYVIHAFDDPEHAILALPAARRYALIAPEASHARHMPSHIFVQLGMWPEATRSNEAAWAASDAWVRKKKLDASYHDYHSLSWLQAVYLEQGQRAKALEAIGRARADLAASGEGRAFVRMVYARMVASYLSETDDWGQLEALEEPLGKPDHVPAPVAQASETGATCHPLAKRTANAVRNETATVSWTRGLFALEKKDPAGAEKAAQTMAETAAAVEPDERDAWRQLELELRGRAAALRGDDKAAVEKLQAAIAIDERTPPSGPVYGVTPRERLGDLYLASGRPADALAAYLRVLELHPRRGRALASAVRAATAAKDPSVEGLKAELDAVRGHADP